MFMSEIKDYAFMTYNKKGKNMLIDRDMCFVKTINNQKLTNVLYNGELVLDFQEEVKKEMFQIFSDKNICQIIDNSDILYSCEDSSYIGKYKDFFWKSGSEGEFYPICKGIQNIVLFSSMIFKYFNDSDYNDLVLNYLSLHDFSYEEISEHYSKICLDFDLEFDINYELSSSEANKFQQYINRL